MAELEELVHTLENRQREQSLRHPGRVGPEGPEVPEGPEGPAAAAPAPAAGDAPAA